MITDNFIYRHNGPSEAEQKQMLARAGFSSMDELINKTIPQTIRLKNPLNLPVGINEFEYVDHLKKLASRNKVFKSYIGMGYHPTITPGVIQRNVLENPGWYTSYTPYQAEISQGRLEALLTFQTMICDLTGMPIANASLLDEATAAAEAMIMLFNARSRESVKKGANKFFVSENLFPQTIAVLKNRSNPLGIELIFGNHITHDFDELTYGGIIQYPDQFGEVYDYRPFIEKAHKSNVHVAVAADLMSLVLLTPPGEWGADVVVGSAQRFGIPMGFGGPHAGYFATTENFKRNIPGRIIGISKDTNGDMALRMALQTREQHIKRERATSNICTAQALLAMMAGFYSVYHGPAGLKAIAEDIHFLTKTLKIGLANLGYRIVNTNFFDTITIRSENESDISALKAIATEKEVNIRYLDSTTVSVATNETTGGSDIQTLLDIFASAVNKQFTGSGISENAAAAILPQNLIRTSDFLTHPVFNSFHSETEMMRYLKRLENKDLALNRTMIPLGSCTMKLNAAAEMFSLSWPEFANLHPFVPEDQAGGYYQLISELEKVLCEITGFAAISFQPNSGASGEYTGLMVIREYLKSKGQGHRNICLIPASAHGTNPASSVMAGLNVIVVKCDDQGNIDLNDLEEKASANRESLAALMVTYPSTHGVYEEGIFEVVNIIHKYGGQVYMDGANMNAQVGLTNPGIIGADVCHLNLHKTFAIPHGGGGPGVGPIGVAEHLTPFLPGHPVITTGGINAIQPVAAAPFGSAFILPISYAYIKLSGGEGLKKATEVAILNANYIKARLEDHYKILYTGKNNCVAHEMILDCNQFLKTADITVVDIAKRIMDYGFHAPTVAFPVHGTLMVEPTESEPLTELERFIEAMIAIRKEIAEIENGTSDKVNNVLKNAPHTVAMLTMEEWKYPYSRQKAAFPLKFGLAEKYWTPVTRIDDAYGDRNLICTCIPMSSYE
ncbi:MAG: aminomethyl-transferring glycine dehydrogenase [Bacteroidetes bacterium]|nr:aminomethyl-transferring glycine dehydrogenase [Bacteroidota bacterium]